MDMGAGVGERHVSTIRGAGYTVGALAALSGVTVRALHHYDDIGLLRPTSRSAAGYRLYSHGQVEILRQILFYRELDFALDDIAAILAQPGAAAEDHLRRQHGILRERIARHQSLLAALEKEMEARAMGIALTPEEQFEVFGTDRIGTEWAAEAEQRWADTDQWAQSRRRTRAYSKEDWALIRDEASAITDGFAAALEARIPADDPRPCHLAEQHRIHISRWFYECGFEIHRGLAELYLTDARFTRNYEQRATGLARYVHDAILANADHAQL